MRNTTRNQMRFWLFLILTVTGCELRRDPRPSVLVVAVENLSFDSVGCEGEEALTGFDVFCEEAIRFTHAFTPSTMSQATLASVLTGLYPVTHGVHDNGTDHLARHFKTAGEVANQKGYRTAFFSGGPPLFRKSGLDQGFELFDDNIEVGLGHFFRPANEVFSLFGDWLNREALITPSFGVLFLSDLQFPDAPTFTQEGDMREKSTESQLQELGDSLQAFVDVLKAKKRWDSTHVILVGMNGGRGSANLRSENTQVTLFIKPARLPRDLANHWTIDSNVSLVDLGTTLMDIFGEGFETIEQGTLEKTSLTSVFTQPEPDWREDRIIYSETGWTKWRRGDPIQIALRQKQFLFINGAPPVIYNSLADHRESTALNAKDPLWLSFNHELLESAKSLEDHSPVGPRANVDFETALSIWNQNELTDHMDWERRQVLEKKKTDPRLVGWWARRALERGDWLTLAHLGSVSGERLWQFVGESHQGPLLVSPEGANCGGAFVTPIDLSRCDDEEMQLLGKLLQDKSEEDRAGKRDRFLRAFSFERVKDRLGQLNYINNAKWDVNLDYPRRPLVSELFLALPKNHNLSKQIQSSLGPSGE